MSNKVYREIVQAGLDNRAAERIEANLEKQARLLRLIINDNHSTKTTPKTTPKASEQPQKAPKKEEPKVVQAEPIPIARREQEAAYCMAWYRLILWIFAPLLVAALALTITTHAGLTLWVTVPILLAGVTLSILTVMVWGCYKWVEFNHITEVDQ